MTNEKTYSTRFAAQRAAQRGGDEFSIVETTDGRFAIEAPPAAAAGNGEAMSLSEFAATPEAAANRASWDKMLSEGEAAGWPDSEAEPEATPEAEPEESEAAAPAAEPEAAHAEPEATEADPFPAGTPVVINKRKYRGLIGHVTKRVGPTMWRVAMPGADDGVTVPGTAATLSRADPVAPAARAAVNADIAAPPRRNARQAAAEAAADAGELPAAPDFSANTHKPYRKRLDVLTALVAAGDIAGLEAANMLPPRSTSPKALLRYRDLALRALRARA